MGALGVGTSQLVSALMPTPQMPAYAQPGPQRVEIIHRYENGKAEEECREIDGNQYCRQVPAKPPDPSSKSSQRPIFKDGDCTWKSTPDGGKWDCPKSVPKKGHQKGPPLATAK